ncbi:MAG: glycosyltransferase family 4 protein [Candidatus Latescibacterota bacterium]|nr:MAG: glycosyltransferase family 4 protein [Candidatus Latescibacterota bacterium]
MTKKRITFANSAVGLAGGVKVVFQYANHLLDAGHDVQIVYPGVLDPTTRLAWRLEAAARRVKYALAAAAGISEAHRWYPLRARIRHVPSLEARYLPPADYLIATGAETAEWVASAPEDRGKKIYFIQDLENWSMSTAAALATWKLPFAARITVATSLAETAVEQGVPLPAVVANGIDTQTFWEEKRREQTPPRILMLSHVHRRKGLEEGFAAVRRVRKTHPHVGLRMFGVDPPQPTMPSGTEYRQQPGPDELRQLYCSSEIYLACGGFGLPPMEAMACGCAVVATDFAGVPELRQWSLVVEPGDVQGMTAAIVRLLEDRDLRVELGRKGRDGIRRHFTLEQAARNFEAALFAV